tara:strand:+ start:9001 stop:10761 length:1761 start_codon:yes stop_codon:yes gene_type:complete
MANYVIATSFGAKDALPSGDAGKIIKGTEFGNEFTAIATAINSKAETASPVFTGTPTVPTAALNDNSLKIANTSFVLQEINSAVAAGTEGLDGTSYLLVSVYQRSATEPTTPTGGSFNFSTLVLTPPTSWSRTIPTGTDPVYLSTATAANTGEPGVDDTLTWSAPVLVFQNGADGSGTDTKAANGYLYYGASSTSAPAVPTANVDTYNYVFGTSTFSNVKAGWSTIFSSPSTSSGTSFWAVTYSVEENEAGAQTITIGGSAFRWLNFDGLVTFSNIQSSVASGVTSIDGGKIVTGTLTADKITAGSATVAAGRTFALGSATSLNGIVSAGAFGSSSSSAGGVLGYSTNNTWGVAGVCFGASGVGGIFANSTDGTFNAYYTIASIGGKTYAGNFSYGSSITVQVANASYGVQLFGSAVGAFTGAHDGLIPKTATQPVAGDIIVDVSVYAKPNVNDALCVNAVATTPNQKGVVGVFANNAGEEHVPSALVKNVKGDNGVNEPIVNPIYTDIDNYNKIIFNALGEGLVNVCGEGGSIEVGDLIVTSSIAGKGMKQADDIIRGYTVAKARESVTFNADEIKQIACIYVAG